MSNTLYVCTKNWRDRHYCLLFKRQAGEWLAEQTSGLPDGMTSGAYIDLWMRKILKSFID